MKIAAVAAVAVMLSGCTSVIQRETVELSNGLKVDYVIGKVAGDGQEAVIRDAWVDGKPVLSNFGSGQSLWGQAMQGAVGAGLQAVGFGVGMAQLRPSEEHTNLSNAQAQDQDQSQSLRNSNSVTAKADSYSRSQSSSSATGNSQRTVTCIKTKWGCKYKY